MVGAAIAAFERTVISDRSAFDRWVKGDKSALTDTQIKGFRLFLDPKKGNCAVCHVAPNFTDNGFHNIGLASFHDAELDIGRYKILPLPALKGAFKTPTLRNISETAPYFHDGSATTLAEVVAHYNSGGVENPYISVDIRPLNLSESEVEALIAFMRALTGSVRSGVAFTDFEK
jgi:cytochrome c peroxidase